MSKFKNAEIVLGMLLGILLFLFISAVAGEQLTNCREQKATEEINQPANVKAKPNVPADQNSGQGDHKKSDISKQHPIACGLVGFPGSVVNWMDHNEGFVVGLFTLLLVGATLLLWRSTNQLWLAGERQLDLLSKSIKVAEKSASATEATVMSSQRTERAYVALSIPDPGIAFNDYVTHVQISGAQVTILVFTNHGKTPATLIEYYVVPQILINWPVPLQVGAAPPVVFPEGLIIGSDKFQKEMLNIRHTLETTDLVRDFEINGGRRPSLYLIGYLRYRDVFNHQYRKGFCVRFNRSERKFFSIERPDQDGTKSPLNYEIQES